MIAVPYQHQLQSPDTIPSITTMVNQSVQLAPGEYHYIKYDSLTKYLEPQQHKSLTDGLSPVVCDAIAKTPLWLQSMLTTQFHHLSNPEPYAQLIINSSRQLADEIAFTIAASSLGKVPPVSVIQKNVEALYRIDAYVEYAEIVDVDNGDNNYYSTIIYQTLEEGIKTDYILPKEQILWIDYLHIFSNSNRRVFPFNLLEDFILFILSP